MVRLFSTSPDPVPVQLPRSGAPAAVSVREKLYAPLKIAAVVHELTKSGACPNALLAGSNLTFEEIGDPQTKSSIDQFVQVCRNAAQLAPDPLWGVRVGQRVHLSTYGMYGFALQCAGTLRQGWTLAVRFHPLATPVFPISWLEDGDYASWRFPLLDSSTLASLAPELYQTLLEMQYAIHVSLIKDIMGSWCIPDSALFASSEPPHAEALKDAFGFPVIFGATHCDLRYPSRYLDLTPQFANPLTEAMMSKACDQLLEADRLRKGIARRVHEELMRMPGYFPEIEEVASILCMTSRTLRRKLEAEGTSYSELLASVRHSIAVEYLNSSHHSTEEIAAMLGYSDAASFRQAFKRWTGKSPSDFRK